jgi:hypothetical protein
VGQDKMEIPMGFRILLESPEELRIVYRSTGMGRKLLFPIIVAVGFCIVLGYGILTIPKTVYLVIYGSGWTPFAFIAGVWATVYITGAVLFRLFGGTVISISSDRVSISRRLFGLGLTKSVPRSDVSHLVQTRDEGENEDTFHSCGLRLIGRKKFWLMKRQPAEKSDWLGNRLAERLHVKYKPYLKRSGGTGDDPGGV